MRGEDDAKKFSNSGITRESQNDQEVFGGEL